MLAWALVALALLLAACDSEPVTYEIRPVQNSSDRYLVAIEVHATVANLGVTSISRDAEIVQASGNFICAPPAELGTGCIDMLAGTGSYAVTLASPEGESYISVSWD